MDWNLDGEPLSLLTTGNPKTAKGEGRGYFTAIMHLAPEKASGVMNVCPHASAGCAAACLNTAGRGGIGLDGDGLNKIQAARIRRTRLFKRDKWAFFDKLADELERHEKAAKRHGLKPAARLNGTSDLPWEKLPATELTEPFKLTVVDAFPNIRFYDYTKWPIRLRAPDDSYHLTFSLSESNEAEAFDALALGVNVAMVFAVKRSGDLPKSYTLRKDDLEICAPVVDGDATDLRFLDPTGVIVGLRAKGRAIGSTTGFVRLPSDESAKVVPV